MLRIHFSANFYLVHGSIMHVRFNLNINQIQWVRIFFILLRHPVFLQWLIFDKMCIWQITFNFTMQFSWIHDKRSFSFQLLANKLKMKQICIIMYCICEIFHSTCNIRHDIVFIQSYVSKNIRIYCILHSHK